MMVVLGCVAWHGMACMHAYCWCCCAGATVGMLLGDWADAYAVVQEQLSAEGHMMAGWARRQITNARFSAKDKGQEMVDDNKHERKRTMDSLLVQCKPENVLGLQLSW